MPVTGRTNTLNINLISEMAIGLWRLQNQLIREAGNKTDAKGKRSYKQLKRLFVILEQAGITIQDKTGKSYDPGLMVKVISSEPCDTATRDIILETLSPAVFHKENILRLGEIIVGKPNTVSQETKEE